MAKRPSRTQANDAAAAPAAATAKGRAKAQRELGPTAIANREPDVVKPNTIASGPETISDRFGNEPDEEEIRARAYQMYLERGGRHGEDFDDWLRAKEELKRRR
jgi:hypothetical protein